MVRDITSSLLEFKEAVRHVWNTYFAESELVASPDIQEAFRAIEIGLLRALVAAPCGIGDPLDHYRHSPLPFIKVIPSEELREVPLQVGMKDSNGNVVWSVPQLINANSEMRMEWIEFFDWKPYGHIDLPLTRVRLSVLDTQPHLAEHDALLQCRHVKFLYDGHAS